MKTDHGPGQWVREVAAAAPPSSTIGHCAGRSLGGAQGDRAGPGAYAASRHTCRDTGVCTGLRDLGRCFNCSLITDLECSILYV